MRIAFLAVVVSAAAACAKQPEQGTQQALPRQQAPVIASDPSSAPVATPSDAGERDAGVQQQTIYSADGEPTSFDGYFSLRIIDYDERRALERTYAKMTQGSDVPLADAVAVCRIAVKEPAPLPTLEWDRKNGRDLLFESFVDDHVSAQQFGALGASAMFARVDDDLRAAAAGKRVRWVLDDRDQNHAGGYHGLVQIADVVVPADARTTLELKAPTMTVSCRGAPAEQAAGLLLDDADRALAAAEKKMEWSARDPRDLVELKDAMSDAAEQIRIGSALARAVKKTTAWTAREDRLRTMVRAYRAREMDWYAHLAPIPVGTWTAVGPRVRARVVEIVCPALAKDADPGSVNDEQREACGLVVELESVGGANVRWDANASPIYACREQGPLRFETLGGVGKLDGNCVLGYRRGKAWQKKSVELSPTQPTVAVLGGKDFGRALRIVVGGVTAIFAVPPPKP